MSEILKQFITERNIKTQTVKGYYTTIKKYTEYYELNIDELLKEAIKEEDENIPKRKRSIKQRLLQFRTHLVNETELRTGTIKGHIKRLITFYEHHDIYVPKLPPLKEGEQNHTSYYDLPQRKHIKLAVESSGLRIGSLLLFMASSGTGRTECSRLTIRTFINGCKEYYNNDLENLEDILLDLYSCDKPIIPTLYLYRVKTDKMYYTFCTSEASKYIIDWLLHRIEVNKTNSNNKTLDFDDTIWNLTTRQITYHLSNLNDELNFGFKGAYRFLRPHSLRKFHASNIGLDNNNIDLLQGRSKKSIHETYIKTNPKWLKELYINHMENLLIIGTGERKIINEDFTININLNFYMNNEKNITI